MSLFKPCQCAGSAAYVHPTCLNTWRETSKKAYTTCQICNYKYKVEKSYWAGVFVNEKLAGILTSVLFMLLIIIIGLSIIYLSPYIVKNFHVDMIFELYSSMNVHPWWRRCRINSIRRSELLNIFIIETKKGTLNWSIILNIFYELSCCNHYTSNALDIAIIGVSTLGIIGLLSSLFRDLIIVIRNRMAVGDNFRDFRDIREFSPHSFFCLFVFVDKVCCFIVCYRLVLLCCFYCYCIIFV